MYESIEEALEDLDKIVEYVEDLNFDHSYHTALEFAQQFREELQTNMNE